VATATPAFSPQFSLLDLTARQSSLDTASERLSSERAAPGRLSDKEEGFLPQREEISPRKIRALFFVSIEQPVLCIPRGEENIFLCEFYH